ncbi:MAG: cyanophycin synthetase [Sterolibacterium sp.]|nr:cyanophycin synthetase [Sterolibacterium sp.]
MSKFITILRLSRLHGPSMWTYRPALEAWVDIGELEESPSDRLPGFTERLIGWLPGLAEHRCSIGEPGGFLQRLREGTWPAHILEHVTLELQTRAGQPSGYGRARETSRPGIYKVVVRSPQFDLTEACLHAARDLVMAAIENRPFDVAATIGRLHALADRVCLGPSTESIVAAARARGIPELRLNEGNLVQLGYGDQSHRLWTAETERTGAIAEGISRDKDLTKQLLQACGLPVPEGQRVSSAASAWQAAEDIGLPVAVKPISGNHGRGISLDLRNRADVEAAYAVAVAAEDDEEVLVERYIAGNEHRLLVVGQRLVAAARGEETWLIGNGHSTIAELIEHQLNSDPRRGEAEQYPLEPVVLAREAAMQLTLERQGHHAASIPAAGQRVLLQRNGNLAIDVTADVHPEVARAACLAARIIGLDIAGIDLVTSDIRRPLQEMDGAIVEVNAGPGLLMHLKPSQGQPQPVGEAIVDYLFPEHADGRIPIIGVAGSRDTTITARLIARLARFNGLKVGLASKLGLYLERRRACQADATAAPIARRLLVNRALNAAVFENDSRSILENGLAYDRCQIGIVTHVGPDERLADHDIHTLEQVQRILRTQVDVVRPDGVAVLNADDPLVAAMAELSDGEVLFFSRQADNPCVARHIEQAGRAVLIRDGSIWLSTRDEQIRLCRLVDVPLAQQGEDITVLAGVAAAWALGIPRELLQSGIETFRADPPGATLPENEPATAIAFGAV